MSSADPNGSGSSLSPNHQQPASFTLPSVNSGLDIDTMTSAPSSAFPQQRVGGIGATPTTSGGGVMGGSGDHPPPSTHSSASMMAPKFPPPNFEVPDISFSNSVSANVGFDSAYFASPASATTASLFQHGGGVGVNTHSISAMPSSSSSSSTPAAPPGVRMMQQQPQPGVGGGYGNAGFSAMGPDGGGMRMPSPAVPAAMGMARGGGSKVCTSPPGTSSSDDSDDLPLAQIASMKRAADAASATNITTTNASSSATETAAGSTTETASIDSSPTPGKKAKVSKRKKKKDPNEPTKPVSAYALFFRDTQATIKNHNPSASFGEVSKIVASMWDQLDPDHKDVYKKKTEMAKKLYLKQLAAYRASQVSQSSADDTEKSPSPPGMSMASPNMVTNPGIVHSTGGQGVMSPSHMSGGPMMHPHHHMAPHMMPHQQPPQQQQQQQFFHPQDPLLQQQQQQQHHQHQMMQHDPQLQQQQQMGGMPPPPYSPPQDQHHHHHHHHHPHHHQQQQHMQQQQQQQQHSPPQHHQQQMPPQQQQVMGVYHHQSPPHPSPPFSTTANTTTNNVNNTDHNNGLMGYQNTAMDNTTADVNFTPCTRNGCINQAQENPAWDSEFCSHDCVITHCRDIFTNWVGARSGSSTFPVK